MRISATTGRAVTVGLLAGLLLTATAGTATAEPAATTAQPATAAAPAQAATRTAATAPAGMVLTAIQQRCFTWTLFGQPVPLHQLTVTLRNDRPGVASSVKIRYAEVANPRSPLWTHTTVRGLTGAETEFSTSFTNGVDTAKHPVLRVDTTWSDGRTETIGPLAPAYACA